MLEKVRHRPAREAENESPRSDGATTGGLVIRGGVPGHDLGAEAPGTPQASTFPIADSGKPQAGGGLLAWGTHPQGGLGFECGAS